MNIPGLLLSIICTLILYALLPILIGVFRKHPITLKRFRRIPIIVSILIALSLIYFYNLVDANFTTFNAAPAWIWTWVGLKIGSHILSKKGLIVSEEEFLAWKTSNVGAGAKRKPQIKCIFKRLLSWLVLISVSALSLLLQVALIGLGLWLIVKFAEGSIVTKFLIYLLVGGNALWMLIMLFIYAPTWSVNASESICTSRRGLRYKILSYYFVASASISVITGIISHEDVYHFLAAGMILIYFILMLVHIKDMVFTDTPRNIIHVDLTQTSSTSSPQEEKSPPVHIVYDPPKPLNTQSQAQYTYPASEPTYLMERDDGTLVHVPASKLEEFDPSKTEPTPAEKKYAEEMAARLMAKYGRKSESEQTPSPPAPATSIPEPAEEPFDLDAFLSDCKNDLY